MRFYRLTLHSSKVLTRSENVDLVKPVVLEDYAVKFGVVEDEKRCIEWRKLGDPRNWVKLGVKIGKIRVELCFNPRFFTYLIISNNY